MRRHRLKLVSTSKVCELKLREPAQNPADALEHGDAMAASPALLAAAQQRLAAAEAAAAVQAEPLSTVDLAAAGAGAAPDQSPVDRVAASLASAASAASSAAQGVYSAAVPYAGALGGCGRSFCRRSAWGWQTALPCRRGVRLPH